MREPTAFTLDWMPSRFADQRSDVSIRQAIEFINAMLHPRDRQHQLWAFGQVEWACKPSHWTSGGFHGTTSDKQLGGAPCIQIGNRRQREPATLGRRKDLLVKLRLHRSQFIVPKLDNYFHLLSRARMICKEEGAVTRREAHDFDHALELCSIRWLKNHFLSQKTFKKNQWRS